MRELAADIQNGLNDTGTETYTVSVNAVTREFTFSATGLFDILATFDIDSLWPVVGIGADQLAVTTFTGATTGNVYFPQYPLQNYLPFEDKITAIDPNKTESTQGIVRSSTLGKVRRMKCNFQYITEKKFPTGSVIKSDLDAYQNARDFMDFATLSKTIEFIADTSNYNDFRKCVLIKTRTSSQGLDYELENLDSTGLPTFKRISNLEFQELP